MLKTLFAALAAAAFFAATPALACDDCKNCPMHKDKVAATDKDTKEAACACPGGDGKTCKCGEKCSCAHCSSHKKAAGEKKS